VIVVDGELCDGCGVCVDVCAIGAIYLVDGKATLDDVRCRDYREKTAISVAACVAACPAEAIILTQDAGVPEQDAARIPMRQPETEVVSVRAVPAPVSIRARVVPALGAAVAWAGREVLPRLADYLLQNLDRRAADGRAEATGSGNGTASRRVQQGRRHRHRRRGS
jgi:ferredoxin